MASCWLRRPDRPQQGREVARCESLGRWRLAPCVARVRFLPRLPVSTSRPSNRTCGSPASGSPTGFDSRPTDGRPSPACLAASAASEPLVREVPGLAATLPALGHCHSAPEVRPLPSPGVTRLHRYYGPVRLPRRPGLSLAGRRLVTPSHHRWGLPCCVCVPVPTCPRHYPGETVRPGVLVIGRRWPSP